MALVSLERLDRPDLGWWLLEGPLPVELRYGSRARSTSDFENGFLSTCSIKAKCSRSSCVLNNNSPVKSSTNIHPSDQISDGYDHGKPNITSGARYCLVAMVRECRSFSK